MEESGEQCTVVFALIVTEPASECMCVRGRGCYIRPPPPLAGSNYAKTIVDCSPDSSMISLQAIGVFFQEQNLNDSKYFQKRLI